MINFIFSTGGLNNAYTHSSQNAISPGPAKALHERMLSYLPQMVRPDTFLGSIVYLQAPGLISKSQKGHYF